jgi:uncharacterized protein YjbI with pentapeptide repeats
MTDTHQYPPIEIKHRWTNDVLFSSAKAKSLRDAVIEAVASGANLSYANLNGANLSDSNLIRADLYGADLYGANLYGANLISADLNGADLNGADLNGADLNGADLYGANLYCANLSGANLSGANLSGADLIDAYLNGSKIVSVAQISFTGHGQCGRTLIAIQTETAIYICCGCFAGSPDELRAWIIGDEKRLAKTRTLALDTALILLAAKNDEVGE